MDGDLITTKDPSVPLYFIDNGEKRAVLSPGAISANCDQIEVDKVPDLPEGVPVTGSFGTYSVQKKPAPKCLEDKFSIPRSVYTKTWGTLVPPANCVNYNAKTSEHIKNAFKKKYPDSEILEMNIVSERETDRLNTVDILFRKGILSMKQRVYFKPSFDCGMEIVSEDTPTEIFPPVKESFSRTVVVFPVVPILFILLILILIIILRNESK